MNDKETKDFSKSATSFGSRAKDVTSKEDSKQGKKGKKGRKGFGKHGRPDIKRGTRRGVTFNDPAWYTKNKTIAEAFAKFPFNYIVGNKPAGYNGAVALPAISSFGVDWSVNTIAIDGTQTTVRDILNEVASIIYTNMRRHNAGSTNDIEYVDVIISNLIAGIDILVNCVAAQRTFKVANSFSWKNRMIPRVIFKHLGLDYDDFVSRQAEYRGRLNTIIAEAMTIKVLNNYPFVNAILAEFSNIFKDSDTDTGREQLMVPVKYFHHIYDPVGTTQHPGGMVRLMDLRDYTGDAAAAGSVVMTCPNMSTAAGTNLNNGPLNYRKFEVDLEILSKQINALVTDSDFNLIQADLEKAFGEAGSYISPSTITSDETFKPEYSGEFWSMFHNGCFLPLNLITNKDSSISFVLDDMMATRGLMRLRNNIYVNSVYQTHDDTTQQVKLSSWLHFATWKNKSVQADTGLLLDTESDDPSVEDVFVMTRYKSLYRQEEGASPSTVPTEFRIGTGTRDIATYQILDAGSNFIVFGGLTTFVYFENNAYRGTEIWTEWENFTPHFNTQAIADALPLIGYEHRPLLLMTLQQATSLSPEVNVIYNEINNVRAMNKNELYHIHETAFLSLWSLPESTNI